MGKKYYGHKKFYKIIEELKEIHSKKNFDYAGMGDPLGNFKRCGQMTKALFKNDKNKELKIALCYMSKHFDAVMDMVGQGRKFKVENLKDKFKDLAIYSILCIIMLEENET